MVGELFWSPSLDTRVPRGLVRFLGISGNQISMTKLIAMPGARGQLKEVEGYVDIREEVLSLTNAPSGDIFKERFHASCT